MAIVNDDGLSRIAEREWRLDLSAVADRSRIDFRRKKAILSIDLLGVHQWRTYRAFVDKTWHMKARVGESRIPNHSAVRSYVLITMYNEADLEA